MSKVLNILGTVALATAGVLMTIILGTLSVGLFTWFR